MTSSITREDQPTPNASPSPERQETTVHPVLQQFQASQEQPSARSTRSAESAVELTSMAPSSTDNDHHESSSEPSNTSSSELIVTASSSHLSNNEVSFRSTNPPIPKVRPVVKPTKYPKDTLTGTQRATDRNREQATTITESRLTPKESIVSDTTTPVQKQANIRGNLTELILALHTRIEQNKQYPLIAQRRGKQGTATIRFLLSPSGDIENIEILQTTGHVALDEAATSAVSKAAPVNEAANFLVQTTQFVVNVTFALDDR